MRSGGFDILFSLQIIAHLQGNNNSADMIIVIGSFILIFRLSEEIRMEALFYVCVCVVCVYV